MKFAKDFFDFALLVFQMFGMGDEGEDDDVDNELSSAAMPAQQHAPHGTTSADAPNWSL